jgi:predicted amino acid racemase
MYPRVEIDLAKLRSNVEQMVGRCKAQGIEIAGVIKGCTGIPQCAAQFEAGGCTFIASSRLEQLRDARDFGIKLPLMLIRLPMLSEVAEAVELADLSLNSEVAVLKALNEEALRQGKVHQVILMADLGDLREGFWDRQDLLSAALLVERDLPGLELAGVGTNLGCYGSINATPEKLEELVACAEMIEAAIGRTLRYISGGATTSLPRVLEGNMPPRVNMLRVGEGILLAKDLRDLWGYDMSFMHQDAFTLKAEIIEVKDKPSHPVGEIMFDAFGFRQVYEDRGIRKRALLALGKVDYAFPDMIYPRDKGIEVLGASSDHTIVDIEESERELAVGDILTFDLCYATIVYVTNCRNVKIVFV